MTISGDTISHIAEIVTIIATGLGVGVPIIRKLTRLVDIFKDFPPHAHLPHGLIAYPKGYEPAPTGKINGDAAEVQP